MTDSISYVSITGLHDDLLPAWLDLYETVFPPEEKVLVSMFIELLKQKEQGNEHETELLAAVDAEGQVAGIGFYQTQLAQKTATLWYIAIDPKRQSQGLGTQFYLEIARRIWDAGCEVILFEVEIPERAHTPEVRILAERRIAFYKRNGAKLLTGIHYLQSVGWHQPSTPMHLMAHLRGAADVAAVFQLAQNIFGDALEQNGELALS